MTGARRQALVALPLGFAIWMAALSLLYALQATGCALSWNLVPVGPTSLLRLLLVTVWALHLAAQVWLFAHCRRALGDGRAGQPLDRFLWRAGAVLSLAAALATTWIGAALLVPSMCAAQE